MVVELEPGKNFNALEAALTYSAVPAENNPSTGLQVGLQELVGLPECATGIWEMGTGVMYDTEVDELFIVLSGEAIIEFLKPAQETIQVAAGSIVRLAAGMQTRWTVTGDKPLRKIYITAP